MDDDRPIYILSDDTERSSGKDAQRANILAATLIAETVRTTLGPKGMDKMLVAQDGSVIVSNDGVTILEEMEITHPAARMVVEVARTQEDEIGDGTTTAVILAGQLLKHAEDLLDDNIHPTTIINGYRQAEQTAQQRLRALANTVSAKDTQTLEQLAMTAMTGKGADAAKQHLATLAVRAIKAVSTDDETDVHNIKIESRIGGASTDSELIEGLVLARERTHPQMPTSVTDADILLLDTGLELKETETSANITITDPQQMQAYLDMEEDMLGTLVERVTDAGADVVCCQKGVDDLVAYHLAKHGVLAVRRVKKSDMEKLAKATGADILSDTKDIHEDALGAAGSVSQQTVGDAHMLYIEDCKHAKAVTLLIRGGTAHVVDEIRRAVTDAIGDLHATLRTGNAVGGAGATETLLAKHLSEHASELSGREQLAVQAYADALEAIPRTLAENAGLDPIDVLTDLRSAQEEWPGIDAASGAVLDAWDGGVIEPLQIKTQALSSATDVATMILRIDDVISAKRSQREGRQPKA